MPDDIWLFEIPWDVDDLINVIDSVGRGSHWAKGPYVEEFESSLEAYFDREYAVTFNSGTTGLESALRALGVGENDEVIVPSFTFVATANAVELAGATPVFADIERQTYGLDPDSVRDRITEDTAAILPIHCYGSACRIGELSDLAAAHDIPLLEDAAEAHGATRDGRLVGSFGDAAVLSFCQNKIVPAGEGGAVVTDRDDVARYLRRYRSHGRISEDYFESAETGNYAQLGTNYRMADVVAALGCSQLGKIDRNINGRRRAATAMNEAFAEMPGVEPHRGSSGDRHVYQLYTVTLEEGVDRQQVIDVLDDRGVASKVYWDPPAHLTEFYRSKGVTADLPVTEDVASRVLSLPMHPGLSPEETERIIGGIESALDVAR